MTRRNFPSFLWSMLVAMIGLTGCDSDQEPVKNNELSPNSPPVVKRFKRDGIEYEEYESERTEYKEPPKKFSFSDDAVVASKIPPFDPTLVHSITLPVPRPGRRPMSPPGPVDDANLSDAQGDWELNFSQTLFRLDLPTLKPDRDADLLRLRASYADAIKNRKVLPSVNLIDGQAKLFDDGLYAAIDLAGFSLDQEGFVSYVDVVQRLANAAGPDDPAAPFLAAGLELADISFDVTDKATKQKYLDEFHRSPLQSKPLGFYNWTPKLQQCYRFLKFFQHPFIIGDSRAEIIPSSLNQLLEADPKLRADYLSLINLYSNLTNAPYALPVTAFSDLDAQKHALSESRFKQGLQPAYALFPPSTSREQRLFDRLFPLGFPEGTDLMGELIRAIRSGKVDLTPHPPGTPLASGWYDYQCHALETMLLPERGTESSKLLLSAKYKQRMFDAFASLITKHRETHVRQLAEAGKAGSDAPGDYHYDPPPQLAPALRLEPTATYYLRMARSYAFLQAYLQAMIGEDNLTKIHGLRESGARELNLWKELDEQRLRFYGFYLISIEDIGLPVDLLDDELANAQEARRLALDWLTHFQEDLDMAVDTRVIVPIAVNLIEGRTQLWGTAGVRLARLDVKFEPGHLPKLRRLNSGQPWEKFEGDVHSTTYLIAIDEFVTIELDTLNCPTREEYRKLCDESETTANLIQKLRDYR
ncbi:MAG: hypothetical protein R3C01_05595 [Planctomycetaceae bacterium]